MVHICDVCDVTVVGTGSDGTNPCLVVTASSSAPPSPEPAPPKILARYLFNIGEGLSRFSGECRVNLSNVSSAFLLGIGSEHHCGLAGLIQSLSNAGKATLKIFGPEGTKDLVDGTSFLLNKRYPELFSANLCLDEDEENASFAICENDQFLDVRCGLARVRDDEKKIAAGQKMGIKKSRTVMFYRCQVKRPKFNHHEKSCFGSKSSSKPDDDSKEAPEASIIPSFMVIFCSDALEAAAVSRHPLFVANESVNFIFHFTNSLLVKDPSYYAILNYFNGRSSSSTTGGGGGFKNCYQHIGVNAGSSSGHGVVYRASAVLSTWLYGCAPRVFPLHSAFSYGTTTSSANEIGRHHHDFATTSSLNESASSSSLTKSEKEEEMEEECKVNVKLPSRQDGWIQGEIRLRIVLLPEIDMGIKEENILAPLNFKGIIKLSEQRISKLKMKDIHEVFNLDLFPLQQQQQPSHYHHDTNQRHGGDENHAAALVLRKRLREEYHRGGLHDDTHKLEGRNLNFVADNTASLIRKRRQQLRGGATNRDLAAIGHFYFLCNPDSQPHADEHMSGLLKKTTISNGEDERIIFLGTGSAAPSKLRGSSGILLNCKGLNMLLDAGEGTYGHLVRHFEEGSLSAKVAEQLHPQGEEGTLKVLCGLDAIWISHKHADHTCGLWRLLCLRRAALCNSCSHTDSEEVAAASTLCHPPHNCIRSSPSLLLVAPSPVLEWIRSCEAAEAHCFRGSLLYTAVDPFFYHTCHLPAADLESIPVEHCYRAYGLVVRLKACGKTLVYSGDTRPSDALIRAGHGSTLLIHEATFDDDMADHAISKRHCTVSEALSVGHRMKAQAIILTHFSQRYPLLPPLSSIKPVMGVEKGKDTDQSVVRYVDADIPVTAAYDGMVVPIAMTNKLSQLHTLVQECLLEGLPEDPCMK